MGRARSTTSCLPPAPAVLLLLLLLAGAAVAAAARLLPPLQPADGGLVMQEGEAAAGNGDGDDELISSISEMMGRTDAVAAESICEGEHKEECLERRLLADAHLDYIYTQHKGKAVTP